MTKISDFVQVKNPRVSSRYSGKTVPMGHFIEDYQDGKIDLTVDFKKVMKHKDEIFTWNFVGHHYKFFLSRFLPEVLIHSQKQDERIIREHYDHKNDLFSWFLGDRMIYTSCYYNSPDETLEQAQDNKLNLIANKLMLKPGMDLLDIGCGWGTLIMHFAKYYNVNTTGVTIAKSGQEFSNDVIAKNGVSDKAKALHMDYRDIPRDKKWDRITCLEMAEHVGVKNFKKFMKQCYDMLKDDGMFYLQIAGLRPRKSVLYGPNQEDIIWGMFMSEYIFSGADASMPLSWDLTKIEDVGFEIHSVENIGLHYSWTIDAWYRNWESNKEKVLEKYGEYTFRMYQIFLAWSVEIAREGGSSAWQIACHKNIDEFDRSQFVGTDKVQLGETQGAPTNPTKEPAMAL